MDVARYADDADHDEDTNSHYFMPSKFVAPCQGYNKACSNRAKQDGLCGHCLNRRLRDLEHQVRADLQRKEHEAKMAIYAARLKQEYTSQVQQLEQYRQQQLTRIAAHQASCLALPSARSPSNAKSTSSLVLVEELLDEIGVAPTPGRHVHSPAGQVPLLTGPTAAAPTATQPIIALPHHAPAVAPPPQVQTPLPPPPLPQQQPEPTATLPPQAVPPPGSVYTIPMEVAEIAAKQIHDSYPNGVTVAQLRALPDCPAAWSDTLLAQLIAAAGRAMP